jgi:CubicO group peptidase (beta-lactamase class C family)
MIGIARSLTIIALVFCSPRTFADQSDDFLQAQMKSHGIPGCTLIVVKSGKQLKNAAYGLANLELNVPATAETKFEIGSITKQFTAAAVLLLEQQGKLSVDDSVTRYLTNAPASWTNITLRHLLSHTSGLKSYTALEGFALTQHLSENEFIRRIEAAKREFQPGEGWKYCNTGFNLLGYVIEHVSGKSYWEFLQEQIFAPLEMASTMNRAPGLVITNRAAGYEQTNHMHINRDYDLTDVFSAGALISTTGDLARWSAALDQEKLLDASSRKKMWTQAKLNSGKETTYGFGWFLDKAGGHKNIGHGGATSGFSASIQRFPDDNLTVILLTNTDEQIATTLAKKIATFFLD